MGATIKIQGDVMSILQQCKVSDRYLYLPPMQLEPKLYKQVDKVLQAMGGKWSRYDKAHVFESDPTDQLTWALTTGEVTDEKKALGFFPTPPEIATRIVDMAEIEPGMKLLEPECGRGDIVVELDRRGFTEKCYVDICEINQQWGDEVARKYSVCLIAEDFLAYNPGAFYDRIVANPPFGMQQDVTHVMHMLDCLAPKGILVSVMSAGVTFRDNLKARRLRERLDLECTWDVRELPEGSFMGSGTMVNTVLLWAKTF